MTRFAFASLAIVVLVSCANHDAPPATVLEPLIPRLAVVGGTVIDGTTGFPRPQHTVLIRGDRIEWVGPDAIAALPIGTEIIDASGRFVIPGLFDAHVHLASPETPRGEIKLEIQKLLDGFLLCGVTSVLDTWSTDEIFELRRLERAGLIESPRLFVVGRGLTAPGSHGTEFGLDADPIVSEAQARVRVQALAALDADAVKVALDAVGPQGSRGPYLDRELVRAITDEAHRHGLPVLAHVLGGERAAWGIEDGVDVLAHTFLDDGFPDAAITQMRERRAAVVPTLVVEEPFRRLLREPEFLRDPWLRAIVDPRILAGFNERDLIRLATSPFAHAAQGYDRAEANVRRLVDGGVRLAAGSDAGNLAVFHGPGLLREAVLLARAGIPTEVVLRALTGGGARLLGHEDELGTLLPGRLADLVVLAADPLRDLENLRTVEVVVKGGVPVDLERLRARVRGPLVRRLDDPLLSDFEDRGLGFRSGGRFFGVLEAGEAPHSDVAFGLAGVSDVFLRAEGSVVAVPFAFAGVACHFACYGLHAMDLRATPTLRFECRGDGGRFLCELLTLDCGGGAFARTFVAPPEWTTVEIKLDRLRRVGLTPDVPLDLARALSLRFITATGRAGPFRLELDNLRLIPRSP